jgi:protein TonB
MYIFPVQSSPREHKILAEIMLIPAKQARESEGQHSMVEKISKKTDESKSIIQVKEEENVINKTGEAVPDVIKAVKPQNNIAKKQAKPSEKVALQKAMAENEINDIHEIKTDNVADYHNEGNISSSFSENPRHESGNASKGVSQPRSASSIAGVDSVIVVNRVKPIYPTISRKRGEEGNVVLLASVENGKVVNVIVEKSSGIKALDSSAISAAGKWSFSSDTNIVVRIPISFRLKE